MTSLGDRTQASQRVFISYRRSDCQPQANGLYDGLTHRLANVRVFMDIDSIPPGVDFEAHIREEINACDVVLVMIGDNWLDPAAGTASRRIDDPDDFVRLEITSALGLEHVRVIPVLVEGAEMPHSTDLPPDIRRLARYNAIELSDKRWTSDVARIAQLLEQMATERTPASQTPPASAATRASAPASRAPGPAASWIPPTVPHFAQVPPRKSWWAKWGMVALPMFTMGLGSFASALWVIRQRPGDGQLRRRMIATAIALGLAALVGAVLVGSAPTDKEGTPTGPSSNVGTVLLLVTMLVGVVLALIYRRREKSRPPGTDESSRP